MKTDKKLASSEPTYSRIEFLVLKSTHDILKNVAKEAGKTVGDVVGMMLATCLTGLVESNYGREQREENAILVAGSQVPNAAERVGVEPPEADNVGEAGPDVYSTFRGRVTL